MLISMRYIYVNALFQPKQVLLQHISTRTASINTFSGYSDSWYLVSQTRFHYKTYCASLRVPLVMFLYVMLQTEETIIMCILALL